MAGTEQTRGTLSTLEATILRLKGEYLDQCVDPNAALCAEPPVHKKAECKGMLTQEAKLEKQAQELRRLLGTDSTTSTSGDPTARRFATAVEIRTLCDRSKRVEKGNTRLRKRVEAMEGTIRSLRTRIHAPHYSSRPSQLLE